ncbi:MAG TPA: arginine deiminase-related protein, partial [Xanthomonadales bacterium]|nr:arginine deiminase-related protein [Xanthomonadales bacterium]
HAPRFAAVPRAVFLVRPDGFSLSTQSASDNAYMDLAKRVDPERALAQHAVLADAIRRHARIPVHVFAGSADTPDAVFPNNVFACTPSRAIVGAMRHPDRQRESRRADIVAALAAECGGAVERMDQHHGVVTELTGPLIVDRARAVGFHGLSERLNMAGVEATHRAFSLSLSFAFDLVPGEYHTNVVMAVLAGRALVLHAASIADPDAARAIVDAYAPHAVLLSDAEKAEFVANCIALTDDQVWMSARAERALSYATRAAFARAGFTIYTVEIDEIEKAGGSLRCCVGEIF